MANCHHLFEVYNQKIRLTDAKRKNLTDARDVIRGKISGYFLENGNFIVPVFKEQGSFVMDTIINPQDDDYDLDDGVYFIPNGTSIREWPKPYEIHRWIEDATKNHTEKIEDKDTCVRVYYAGGFHIDLPMYRTSFYDPELAHKRQGWIVSNPTKFIEWFEEKVGSGFERGFILESSRVDEYTKWFSGIRDNDRQLRRIVRYLKGWADDVNTKESKRIMPSGIILTILAAEKNYKPDDRDDMALYNTIANIHAQLSKEFKCKRPTTPEGENLLANYKDEEFFMGKLKDFLDSAYEAVNHPNQKGACLKWKRHLGPRFPCNLVQDDDIEGANTYESPAILHDNAGSA